MFFLLDRKTEITMNVVSVGRLRLFYISRAVCVLAINYAVHPGIKLSTKYSASSIIKIHLSDKFVVFLPYESLAIFFSIQTRTERYHAVITVETTNLYEGQTCTEWYSSLPSQLL